jgi:hypothetical protein
MATLCMVLNSDCPFIRGLGTELVKRSEILARDLGCEVAVAIGQFFFKNKNKKHKRCLNDSNLVPQPDCVGITGSKTAKFTPKFLEN